MLALWWFLPVLFAAPTSPRNVPLPPAHYLEIKLRADSLWASGKRTEALPLYETLLAANPEDGDLKVRRARGLWAAGRKNEALPLLIESFDSGFGNASLIAWWVATQEAANGDSTQAFQWIERSLESGLEHRPELKEDAGFAPIKDTAGFRRLAGFAPASIQDRVSGWRYDLDYFLGEAQRLHADPKRIAWSPAFVSAVDSLKKRVPELGDAAVALELQKIVVRLGDGHSAVYPMPTERIQFAGMLPVSFYVFRDGLFVIGADPDHQNLIGMRVERIGKVPAKTALSALGQVVSRDNANGMLWIGPLYLRSPDVLRAIGAVDAPGAVPLRLIDRKGASHDASLVPAPPKEMNERLLPPPGHPPAEWLARVGENYWDKPLPDLDAVYVQFNEVHDSENGPSIEAFARDVRDLLTHTGASNLIVDVRHNNGGNNFLVEPLVTLVAWHDFSDPKHRTFVITSRGTFSACQNFINRLERDPSVVYVGEPSSGKPNSAGENTPVELPWSGLHVSIASRWFQDSNPGDNRPYIPVSMPVAMSSEDWWQNRDPVMQALGEYLRSAKR